MPTDTDPRLKRLRGNTRLALPGAAPTLPRPRTGTDDQFRSPVSVVLQDKLRAAVDGAIELRRAAGRAFERTGQTKQLKRTKNKVVVLVPAHNEEKSIAATIESILTQTRRPDRVVVVADNCTDKTVEVARRYKGVTVVETVDNTDRKVGALTQGWQLYEKNYDYVVGVDADTVLAPDCIDLLEKEMVKNPKAGGVMARYTFDEKLATTRTARTLLRCQRLEFAGWTMDMLRRQRRTYVLGGQATMFRADALRQIASEQKRHGPWSTEAQVEDMELTWQLSFAGWDALVSKTARAYVGPMLTLRSLWAQRRKWDEGTIRILLSEGISGTTLYPWRLQFKMLLELVTRTMFVALLVATLLISSFVWLWIWAIPTVLAVLINLRTTRRMPHRTSGDYLSALLVLPAEMYLWFRLAVWATSWVTVVAGIRRDGWARQYRAEGVA